MKQLKKVRLGLAAVCVLFVVTAAVAQESDQVDGSALKNPHAGLKNANPRGHLNGQAHARFGIFDIDSIPNFNGQFFASGFSFDGTFNSHWYVNTVGNPPQLGGTTTINAPIIPVSLDLRNFDGSPRFVNGHRLISDVTPFIQPTLNSPVFANANWETGSAPTQITDAMQRAEFFKSAKPDWHTLLSPVVKTARTMTLIRGTYAFALNADGSCCRFVLVDANTFVNKLFPPTFPVDNSTVIGAAELAGDMTTKDITTLLFPNTFLFVGNTSNCCILGFHSYDFEPGVPENGNRERRYVMNYSSWISAGIFGSSFTDVTAVSHEIAELYNDPFVVSDAIHNLTPFWLAPNGICDDSRETGDVIEGLPNSTFPITMNGFTYHPQNEALLQWFEFLTPSDASNGSYSFPNPNVLTSAPTPQPFACTP